ncbi:MAG: hypothetical protein U0R44_05185 [Candidatus Micrarchaeia archaeon]
MASFLALVILIMLAGNLFAQGAEQYCSRERAQGESCYRDCCENMGYSWSGGCNVPEAEKDSVSAQCGYCTDPYVQCVSSYQTRGSAPSGSGCCAGFILPLFAAGAAVLRKQ